MNSGNPELPTGSDKELECDLLPLGIATDLDGVWVAFVNGATTEIGRVNESAGRAKILPPSPPGYYPQATSFNVTCIFRTPDGTDLFTMNRTVSVTGKCWSVPIPYHGEER